MGYPQQQVPGQQQAQQAPAGFPQQQAPGQPGAALSAEEQQKWIVPVATALASAAPSIISALRKELAGLPQQAPSQSQTGFTTLPAPGFAPGQLSPEEQQKWIVPVASMLAGAVPAVIDALNKGQAPAGFPQQVPSQAPPMGAMSPEEVKNWFNVASAAISAAPGLINSIGDIVRGKDVSILPYPMTPPGTQAMTPDQMKNWYNVASAVITAAPGIIDAVRGK
jgi:hypothetical protein